MQRTFVNLMRGDPAPRFTAATESNPRYIFDTVAGRYVVLCFFVSGSTPGGAAALGVVAANRRRFDDERLCFFGVTVDPKDRDSGRVQQSLPGVRHFWDFDGSVSRLYGAVPRDAGPGGQVSARQFWVVLDPTLRVLAVIPFQPGGAEQAALFACLDALPPPHLHAGQPVQAPVLVLPNVFEPDFCRSLIDRHEADGGRDTGFMSEVAGKTVELKDPARKRRRDFIVEDEETILAVQRRIRRRIVPEIARLFFFEATRIERYLVGCYTAEEGGHFAPHRDNTTKGTAHRRFAVSINLNEDFDGGEVSFPEYGPRGFKPPVGGAVVFSCSLMHAVSAVSRGRRYAFLPFLYDEAAAKIRAANNRFLDPSVGAYKGA
ncbi:2OG-Fe(II) oxygenase [Reyranella sp.]|uniref:2OG-Fe(II) oxygenase n=1 Tax=Reyranella sp. TaxID=1929291 RepID=UPI003BAC46FA